MTIGILRKEREMRVTFKKIAILAIIFAIAFAFIPDMGVSKAYAGDSIDGGTYKASELKIYAGENLFCSGDITIVMDTDLELWTLNSDYDITIKNSGSTKHKLTFNGKDAGIKGKNLSMDGISLNVDHVPEGDIGGGTIAVYATNNVKISNSKVLIHTSGDGIISYQGSVTIENTELNLYLWEYDGTGVLAADGYIAFKNVKGTIDAEMDYCIAVDTGGEITISNCDLTVLGDTGCIYAGSFYISANNYVKTPASYKLVELSNGQKVISNSKGITAKKVVFSKKYITDEICTISVPNKVFTGSRITPVVVKWNGNKLTKDTHYTVKYTNNLNVGTAKVVITGKGNYKGTVTKTFKILPKGTTLLTPTPKSKGVTVKWNAQKTKMSTSYITGYQINLAKDSKFTKGKVVKTVTGPSVVSKSVTGLAGSTTYYVRIRTYKVVSGVTYYSPWSALKTVKTKA
ncbi:MAG: fibronectin type III domain-containing protein [Firmicutes bacterium]|nr:fibronectin type III domain-containing protein [Bacillota bacterium]MBR6225345.1 fibronectin type III domain-containing protein [Bacillota bacterium]